MSPNRKGMQVKKIRTTIAAATIASLLVLTGCASDSKPNSEATDDAQSAPSGPPEGFDTSQLEEIRECLEAAGLDDVFPTDLPSDVPSDRPTDFPSDRPTDFPTDGPSGVPGGDAVGLQDPEVQAALEACGIELPQGPDAD